MNDETDEPTSIALFENHQWQVTDYGIESVKPAPTYKLLTDRLLETRGAGVRRLYNWPVHMTEKTWVDIEAFIEAFTKALELHAGKFEEAVDSAKFAASITKARLGGGRGKSQKKYAFLQ